METLMELHREGGWAHVARAVAEHLLAIVVLVALAAIPLALRYYTYLPR